MTRITSFVVCDSITNFPANPEKNIPSLVAPQIALRPQFIPGNFSFGIAVGISGLNLHAENKVRFTIVNPKGIIVHDTGETPLRPIPVSDTLPAEYQGFMLTMDIRNLVIQIEGEYKFVAFVNGKSVGEAVIPIYKRA